MNKPYSGEVAADVLTSDQARQNRAEIGEQRKDLFDAEQRGDQADDEENSGE